MYRYEILVKYIRLYFEKNVFMTKEDAELILKALEDKE